MTSVERLRTPLLNEMTAYETMRKEIETNYPNRWIILFDSEVIGDYDDYDAAFNARRSQGDQRSALPFQEGRSIGANSHMAGRLA